MLCLVTQSCLTLCDAMDCSLPGSPVHGIFQARILEWVAFPPPGDLPNPEINLRSPALHVYSLLSEPPGKPIQHIEGPKDAVLKTEVFWWQENTPTHTHTIFKLDGMGNKPVVAFPSKLFSLYIFLFEYYYPDSYAQLWIENLSCSCCFICITQFFKFIFKWKIIALQCCVGFCHIATWICHVC